MALAKVNTNLRSSAPAPNPQDLSAIAMVIGPAAAGKSVLCKALCGLVPVAAGAIHVLGERVDGRSDAALGPLRRRLQALGITHVHYGTEDKRPAAEQTLQALGLDWSQAAAIGDDWPDLPVLRRCAFAAAPANAHPEALACARYVTRLRGGEGAGREFCDLLLVASGRYAGLLQDAAS
mgnify:CR=1 FL=1